MYSNHTATLRATLVQLSAVLRWYTRSAVSECLAREGHKKSRRLASRSPVSLCDTATNESRSTKCHIVRQPPSVSLGLDTRAGAEARTHARHLKQARPQAATIQGTTKKPWAGATQSLGYSELQRRLTLARSLARGCTASLVGWAKLISGTTPCPGMTCAARAEGRFWRQMHAHMEILWRSSEGRWTCTSGKSLGVLL